MNNRKHNLGEYSFSDAKLLRIRAEEKIEGKKDRQVLEPDVKKLLHELQVHQVELEMQNEELKQAYEIAEDALRKYTLLYDFAPTGYITLNSEGIISEMNFTGAEILGSKRHSIISKNLKTFIADDSKLVFNNFLKKIYSGKVKEYCTIAIADRDSCRIYLEGVVIGNDQCLLSVVDISSLQHKNNTP